MTFDEFLAEHLRALLRYASMLTCDPHLAQDVIQEVLLRAHGKWASIGTLNMPQYYVRRMITNEYLSWRRRRASRDVSVAPAGMVAIAPAEADPNTRYDEREAMLARIATLPRRQRTAVVLRYYYDLTDDEIADTMHCRAGSVRSYLSRAVAALRAQATDDLPQSGPTLLEQP